MPVAEQSEQVLRAVLAHEMAHIKRRDFFFNLLFEFLLLPFAFHPAALAVRSRIARTREQACDEVVAGRSVEAPAYARALLDLARLFSPARAPRYSVGACDTDVLEERIMRIMKLRDLTGSRRTRFLLVCACLAVLALGVVAAALPIRVEQPQAQADTALLTVKGTVPTGLPALPGAMPATGQIELPEAVTAATPPAQAQQVAAMGNQLEARNEVALGVQTYKDRQFDQAAAHFKRATELDPSSVNARLYLATTYAAQFQPGNQSPENMRLVDAAISEYGKVLQAAPDNASALTLVTRLLFQLQKYDEARALLEKLIEVQPDNAEAYYSLGVIDWVQTYKPRITFKTEHGIRPEAPIEPASLREEVCGKLRPLIDDGMRMLNKAIELRPDHGDARLYLNLMYRERADCQATPTARVQDTQQADELIRKVTEAKKQTAAEGREAPAPALLTAPSAPPPPPRASAPNTLDVARLPEYIKTLEEHVRVLREQQARFLVVPTPEELLKHELIGSEIRATEERIQQMRKLQ